MIEEFNAESGVAARLRDRRFAAVRLPRLRRGRRSRPRLPVRLPSTPAKATTSTTCWWPLSIAPDLDVGDEDEPFLRYRRWLSPYRLARAAGLSDAAWFDVAGVLDEALKVVDDRGFVRTPFTRQPELAAALGLADPLWIKDETGMSRARTRAVT